MPRGALGGYSLSKSSGSGICDVPFPFPACALQRLLPAQAGLRLLLVPPLRRLRLGWEVGRWEVGGVVPLLFFLVGFVRAGPLWGSCCFVGCNLKTPLKKTERGRKGA